MSQAGQHTYSENRKSGNWNLESRERLAGEETRENKGVSAARISMLSLISTVWSSFIKKEFFNTHF